MEQAKSISYDFLKFWINKSGAIDKATCYENWVSQKFPKKDAALAYTTRLILSIENHSEISQEMKLLNRVLNEPSMTKDVVSLLIKINEFMSVQRHLPKYEHKNMDAVFASKQDVIFIREKFFPTKVNLALDIYDYIKAENVRCKILKRKNKEESNFLERCLKVEELSVPYLEEYLIVMVLKSKQELQKKIDEKQQRALDKLHELNLCKRAYDEAQDMTNATEPDEDDICCLEDDHTVNQAHPHSHKHTHKQTTKNEVSQTLQIVEEQKMSMVNQLEQLRKQINIRKDASAKMIGLIKCLEKANKEVRASVETMRKTMHESKKWYEVDEKANRRLFALIGIDGITFQSNGSSLSTEPFKKICYNVAQNYGYKIWSIMGLKANNYGNKLLKMYKDQHDKIS